MCPGSGPVVGGPSPGASGATVGFEAGVHHVPGRGLPGRGAGGPRADDEGEHPFRYLEIVQ